MAGVAPVLLDEVEQQAAQAGVGAVAGTDVRHVVEPSVGECSVDALA